MTGADRQPDPASRLPGAIDAASWDAIVALDPRATYHQTSAWARVKAPNGWRATRVVAAGSRGGLIGAQILLRRPRLVPWSFGYAPRGPLAGTFDASTIGAWSEALRRHAWEERVGLVRIDPEIEAGGPLDPDGATREAFRRAGWHRAASIQPSRTRVVDLRVGEDALWSGLRKKWRQYVNRARSRGVTIVEAGGDRLPDFHAIMTETARRAGTRIRAESAYRDVWDAFHPTGGARLLFAVGPGGDAQAALFLLRTGDRVVEPYGGMTAAGADSRANYLVKWEAIRSSCATGAVSYDMWGLVRPGIRQFKAGFGGREIEYIGGLELAIDRLGATAYRTAGFVQGRAAAIRRRVTRSPSGALGTGYGTEEPVAGPVGDESGDGAPGR